MMFVVIDFFYLKFLYICLFYFFIYIGYLNGCILCEFYNI